MKIALWPPNNLSAALEGTGACLTASLRWAPPVLNADEVGGYQVERTTWWWGTAPKVEILDGIAGDDCFFQDPGAVADQMNQYRVRAIHRRFPAVTGPWSLPALVYGFAFLRYEEMVQELKALSVAHPEVCRLVDAGPAAMKPYRIWCVVLGTDTGDRPDRHGLLLAGNIHGGEIEGGDLCMAFVREIISRWKNNDPAYRRILERSQVRIVPFYNPCGRSSHESGFPGNVRKNRPARLVPPSAISPDPLGIQHRWFGDTSIGLDPNRTFDADWRGHDRRAARDSTYAGGRPFAAPETRALAKMAKALKPQISVHYHGPCGYPLLAGDWLDGSALVDRPLHYEVARGFASRSNPPFANDVPSQSPHPQHGAGGVAQKWFYKKFYGAHFLAEGFNGQVPGDARFLCVAGSAEFRELVKPGMDAVTWMLERLAGAGLLVHACDERGRPVEAEVEVQGHIDSHCLPQKTDRKYGNYRRILSPGIYTVRVSAPGFRDELFRAVHVDDGAPTALKATLLVAKQK